MRWLLQNSTQMYFGILLGLLLVPGFVFASTNVFVTPPEVDAYTYVDDPTRFRQYYGELANFPHTYVLTLTEPTEVVVQIMEPASDEAYQNTNGLIVREVERGVEDVARLYTSDTNWEKIYVFKTGDSYRLGPAYRDTLPAGTYYVEVSNGDNAGKYVLQLGTNEYPNALGYVGTLKEIATLKAFLGKPAIAVLQSPYYFVPVFLLLSVVTYWYRRRRTRYA